MTKRKQLNMHKYIRKHSTHQHHPSVKYKMHIGTTIPGTKRQRTKPKHRKQTTFLAKHSMHWWNKIPTAKTKIDKTKAEQENPKPENNRWKQKCQTKSPQQKPKSMKQKLNRKNKNWRIIAENKNVKQNPHSKNQNRRNKSWTGKPKTGE